MSRFETDDFEFRALKITVQATLLRCPILALVTANTLVACTTLASRDVTESPRIAESGWHKGTVYEATKPLFLLHDRGRGTYLLARSNADDKPLNLAYQCWSFTLPRDLRQYELQPGRWPEIERVLPAGTKIRFDSAYQHGAVDWTLYDLDLRAVLVDNPMISVNLACVSTPDSQARWWRRDAAWLR